MGCPGDPDLFELYCDKGLWVLHSGGSIGVQTFSSELWEGREAEEVKPSTILGQLYGPVGPAVEDGKWRQRSEPQDVPRR